MLKQSSQLIDQLIDKIKKNYLVALVVLVAAVGVFWLLNKSPLQGTWSLSESDDKISAEIKGKKIKFTILESGDSEVTLSGKLKRRNNDTYFLPVADTKITVRLMDAVEDKKEFDEYLEYSKEISSDTSLSTSDRKKVDKFIKSIKLSGTDILIDIDMKDYLALENIDTWSTTMLNIVGSDFTYGDLLFKKNSSNTISLSHSDYPDEETTLIKE